MKRRLIFWALVVIFIWVIISRFTEIQGLIKIFSQGKWQWVLAAALIQVVYYIVYTASYQSAFSTVEIKSRLRDLLPITFGALFVNVVAPVGGMSGAALFVDDANRRGESPARATAGTLLQQISDFSSLTLIVILGMIYLFLQHHLQTYEMVGAVALLAITTGLSGVLMLGLWRPTLLKNLLSWIQKTINEIAEKFHRKPWIAEEWAGKNSKEFSNAGEAIKNHPQRLFRTLGIALVAHAFNIASLYAVIMAFYGAIGFGILVAGYAMGVLFWVVSPIPQGIGVVEGVIALVFTSFHIPGAISTTISLAFRGLTFWLPLALGFMFLRHIKSFGMEKRSLAGKWTVRLISLLTAAMGFINLLSAVTPSLANRLAILEKFLPLSVRVGGHLTSALAGFALLLLSGGLWRRKRIAWGVTLVVLTLSVFSHLIKGLDYEEAALAAGLAVWLIILRRQFYTRSDAPSIRQGLRVLLLAICFTLAYGSLGFYLLDRHYSVNFGLWDALKQTVVMFVAFYNPGLQPVTRFGRYFANSIYIVGASTLGYALVMLIRPVIVRQPATPAEHERARRIVETYGKSELARLALMQDKTYCFSPGGSVIAFVAKNRVAVALGDPIGPPEDIANAIADFKEFCTKNDWQATFYQVLPDYLDLYRKADFNVLHIGDEAILDLQTFTMDGKAGKALRIPYNHLTRMGHQAVLHELPLDEPLLDELRSVSDEWLVMMHGSEKRFSLGWFDNDYIRNSQVMAVHLPDGRVSAFANIIPEYQKNEVTSDLMRRRRKTEGGTMDYLFASLFLWAKSRGYATFNLGLSSLANVGEKKEDPIVERGLHYIYEHIDQFYNFKGLHEYKEKFHPQWSPRFIVYPGSTSLPGIALAYVRADSGDTFLQGMTRNIFHKREA